MLLIFGNKCVSDEVTNAIDLKYRIENEDESDENFTNTDNMQDIIKKCPFYQLHLNISEKVCWRR